MSSPISQWRQPWESSPGSGSDVGDEVGVAAGVRLGMPEDVITGFGSVGFPGSDAVTCTCG